MADTTTPFVSVKFDAIGRAHRFLLPEAAFDPPLRPGEDVVVSTGDRRAYGTVTPEIPQLDAARQPSETSRSRVVRRASKQDVLQRLKQRAREREAYRVGSMKIKERSLAKNWSRSSSSSTGNDSSSLSPPRAESTFAI